jgi:hypothetical protein
MRKTRAPQGAAEAEEKRQPGPAALVAAAMREMAEPKDGIAPTPVWLMLFFFVLAGWSAYYIAKYAGAFRSDVYNEHFVEGGAPAEKPTPADPMVLGRQTLTCACNAKILGKRLPALTRLW